MSTDNDKLDTLVELVTQMRIDLAAHYAMDEAAWKRVDENEEDIKQLVQSNGKVKTRLAVITATIAGGAAGIPSLLRLLL